MRDLTEFRSITIFALFFFAVASESEAASSDCPTPTSRPQVMQATVLTQSHTLIPYSITQTVANYYDAPFGLGFLEVVDERNPNYYEWWSELELPLWQSPDASAMLGWLLQGKIHTATGVETLTGAGMVETGYEHTSFIVWEIRDDWLKLRLTGNMFAWINRCHLDTAKLNLALVPWQSFLRRHADWLHFRRPVPHILRASPSINGERITTIGLDHKLRLHDIQGDWIEVEVEEPDITCNGPNRDESQSIQHRGWVKWRDEQGPWVYVYTRGC